MDNIILKTATLDGKHIAYHNFTEFRVQVGRGKSTYKDRYLIIGNLGQAVMYFRGINIGNGYKKRLVCWEFKKPVIARQFSA